ncbi:MAG: circularly permuted type 2 ATP-grasp protein, partial [Lachnospiraceae bacterium]|nr:circularly permuted type 2 ATP-grasp protein [Lachnospiraceae bacterium]
KMTKQEKEDFIALLKREPRRFIAQEVIDFLDIDILERPQQNRSSSDGGRVGGKESPLLTQGTLPQVMENYERVPRKADLRAFVLMAVEARVWKSGLTRFSRNPDSFIVNSSQGGGFKDTWVFSQ